MAEEEEAEKSHEATPKKLEEARKRGELPKSTDLTAAASYLGLILSFVVLGPFAINTIGFAGILLFQSADLGLITDAELSGAVLIGHLLGQVVIAMTAIMAIPVIFVLAALTAQRAWVFAPSRIEPKLSKISMLSGAKNKFGANGLFEFAKSAFKLCVVCGLLGWFAVQNVERLLAAVALSTEQGFSLLGDLIVQFLLMVFVLTLLVGGVDYLWQVASHLRKNRMSRKEVEDETKSTEGDPHHKQTRRQRGYEIAMNQMLAEVPKADVILVNPTHFAVALKWSRTSKGAPVLVAKGADEIAARIREIAQASNIPIHSDPPTTRALHATIEIGQQIAPEHYRAVAVAIRFAEKMRSKAARR